MAKGYARSSIRPRVLQRTLGACQRDYQKLYAEWQDAFPGFRERLPAETVTRLKDLGRIVFCFDLRLRWATGITGLEFDDRVITKASTGATRQGYFLLMRLVDLWFSLDLAFEMYARLHVPARVEHPNLLVTLQRDAARRLRAARAAAQLVGTELERRLEKPAARDRLVGWLEALPAAEGSTLAADLTREAAQAVSQKRALAPQHAAAVAQVVRNRYVHGGETASSHGLSAQEKVPFLRLLVGFAQVVALELAGAATGEMLRQMRRSARFG